MDKDITLLLAEMLIKQDELTAKTDETNLILTQFMGITVKQFEQQQSFNERFAAGLEKQNAVTELMLGELKEIKESVAKLANLEERIKAIEERESKFESRLANIERLLKAS